MKTFKLIGMALVAVFVSVNFASCSSNDDDDPSGNGGSSTTTKKLVEITERGSGEAVSLKFTYDSNGRVSSIKGYEANAIFIWSDNVVIMKDEDGYDEDVTVTISNGLATKEEYEDSNDDGYSEIKYNSSNRLVSIDDNPFTWEGNRVTKIGTSEDQIEYTYTGINHKGWAPTIGSDSSFWGTISQYLRSDLLYYAHPELLGIKDCELPSKRKVSEEGYEDDVETTTITYTFYDDGYVETRSEVRSDGYSVVYTYKWE